MNPVTDRRGARLTLPALAMGVLLGACTVIPVGPSVMALPGSRMGVDQYQADNAACQQHAGAVIAAASGGTAAAADNAAASTAAAGSSYTAMSSYQLQRGYDGAYLQCMYDRGHRVPVRRDYTAGPSRPVYLDSGSAPSRYPPPNMPPPPAKPGAQAPAGYPVPADVPPSSYPPPDTPPPAGLPPRS
jgi:hypothetical protein